MAKKQKRLTQREKAERAAIKKQLQADGVLKLLKLAVEYNVFLRKLESEGRTKYTYGELIDEVILPITNL